MIWTHVNWLAILVGAIGAMAAGFLWYSPFLFGKLWMQETGMTPEKMAEQRKSMTGKYLLSFVVALVTAYFFAVFLNRFGSAGAISGIKLAVGIWFGFIATTKFNENLFGGKSMKLYAIDTVHFLFALGVMGAIIGAWK